MKYLAAAFIAILAFIPSIMLAEVPGTVLRAMGLPGGRSGEAARIETMQTNLSWIGIHKGQINGQLDALTRDAVMAFQLGLRERASGVLTASQENELARRASAVRRAGDFRVEEYDWTGSRITIPAGFFDAPIVAGDTKSHLSFQGRDVARSEIYMQRYFSSSSAAGWLGSLKTWADKEDARILISGTAGSLVYMVALVPNDADDRFDDRRIYMIYETNGREVRGIDISFMEENTAEMRPVVAEILKGFDAMHGSGIDRNQIDSRIASGAYPGAEGQPDWYRFMIANGSGSIVSTEGHVLTNHHVVSGCVRLTVNGTPASLLASDVRVDLALVLAPKLEGRNPVRFSARAPELGDEVLVLGYPVFNISPSLNATTGVVSSSVGYRGDRTRIQITAPIQPGNSGGPVVTTQGAQVAVVSSKPTGEAQLTRNIENIGWVIRASEAEDFLRRFGVQPVKQMETNTSAPRSIAEGIRDWRRFTVRVECQAN